METIEFMLPFAAAFALLILIRVLAGQDHVLGHIMRLWWNANFKLAAHIPFCGWMTHLIIADTPEEKKIKEEYVDIGRETDDATYDYLTEKERQRQEEEERQAKLYEEQHRLEREISSCLKNKSLPVHIHGDTVDIGQKSYALDDVLNKLNLD